MLTVLSCITRRGRLGEASLPAASLPAAALPFAAFLAFATPLPAQDAIQIDPVRVTVGRFDAGVVDVPAAVDVAGPDLIHATAAADVSDVLQEMGVTLRSFTGNPAQASVDLRGFGETGNLNVLVLVDGRRVNAPDMTGINWLDLPLESIDRIEVIRGAQTALYGNNAAGGVINITTRVPNAPGGAAVAGVGSWGARVARMAAWSPLGDVRVRAEAGYESSDGYRENSSYTTKSASASVASGSAFQWRATVAGGDTHLRFPGPLDHTQFETDPRHSEYAPFGDRYSSDTRTLTATASVDGSAGAAALHGDAGFHRRNLSWNLDGVFADSTLDTWNLGPRLRWGSDDRVALTLGGDVEYDALDFDRFADFARMHGTQTASLDRWTAGLFASTLAHASDVISLTATVRSQWHRLDASLVEGDSSERGNDIGASVGATWKASPTLRVYARADRFFRYPALDEVATFQGYPGAVPFNADLRSERGWGGELGADWARGPFLFRVTAFGQDVDGMIAYDYMRRLNVNLADGRRIGAEAGAQWRSTHWSAGAFYTVLKTTFSSGPYDGRELYLVPRHQVSGHLAWMPAGWLSLRGDVRYVGSSFQGNDLQNRYTRLPAYAVVDVLVRVRLARGWQVYAGVDNALDRHYATLLYLGGWYPAPSHGYRAGVQWTF